MNVGGVIFPLLLLRPQTCNSWSQQLECCWLPEHKTPLQDKLLHFVWNNCTPSDAVIWDTRLPIIWTPAGCINTHGRTWDNKDISRAEDCWQLPRPLGHLLPSGGQAKWARTTGQKCLCHYLLITAVFIIMWLGSIRKAQDCLTL